MSTIEQMASDARAKVLAFINRSAGQHLRQMRSKSPKCLLSKQNGRPYAPTRSTNGDSTHKKGQA